MSILDYQRLDQIAAAKEPEFRNAQPFPYVVIDDFVPAATLETVLAEFGDGDEKWTHWRHYNEIKQGLQDITAMEPTTRALIEEMNAGPFLKFVEKLTGIGPLIADSALDGGGLHLIKPGGFLNVHADFQSHTVNRNWNREINLLLYLNKNWCDDYNGNLEFWNAETRTRAASITPHFNRLVMFHTTERSLHGHPDPLVCPAGSARKSIALYYYRDEGRPMALRSTDYWARPTDSPLKRALITADNVLIRTYSFLKRYTPLNDRLINKILRRL